MRGSAGGTNASVDAYVSIGTSLDVLHVPGECSKDVELLCERFSAVARLSTNGQAARRMYRLLDGSCKSFNPGQ